MTWEDAVEDLDNKYKTSAQYNHSNNEKDKANYPVFPHTCHVHEHEVTYNQMVATKISKV